MTVEYAVEYYMDEGGGWNARVPDLPGCFSCGDSLEEAKINIKEAMEGWILARKDLGLEVPLPQSYVFGSTLIELSA